MKERLEAKLLRWFGYLLRMGEEGQVINIWEARPFVKDRS